MKHFGRSELAREWAWAVAVVALWCGLSHAQEKVWVTSAGAKVMSEAAATAKAVETVPVGTELTVLSTKDKWFQVSLPSGEKGWIFRGKVSTSPPEAEREGGGLLGALGKSSIEGGSADTSRSMRGLSPAAEQYAQNAKTPAEYKKAVDGVLALQVKEAEVDAFLREGKIGEYAE
jgi:uncharacterized protein YgiM (DUF1202 family)